MSLTLEDYEKLNPRCEVEHEGVKMLFSTPNTFTYWRVESIYQKEPWTLEWIAGFEPGDILLGLRRERRHVHDMGGCDAPRARLRFRA